MECLADRGEKLILEHFRVDCLTDGIGLRALQIGRDADREMPFVEDDGLGHGVLDEEVVEMRRIARRGHCAG